METDNNVRDVSEDHEFHPLDLKIKGFRECMADMMFSGYEYAGGYKNDDFLYILENALLRYSRSGLVKNRRQACYMAENFSGFLKNKTQPEAEEYLAKSRKIFESLLEKELQEKIDGMVSRAVSAGDTGIVSAKIHASPCRVREYIKFRKHDVEFTMKPGFIGIASKFMEKSGEIETLKYGKFSDCLDSLLKSRKLGIINTMTSYDSIMAWLSKAESCPCEEGTYKHEGEFSPAYLLACLLSKRMSLSKQAESDDLVYENDGFLTYFEGLGSYSARWEISPMLCLRTKFDIRSDDKLLMKIIPAEFKRMCE